MDRKAFLLQRRLRYMLLLFVVFLALFGIFDLIVYAVAEGALYEDVDRQMEHAAQAIESNVDGAVENFQNGKNIVYTDRGSYVITYRIFLLLRDRQGNILNAEYLSSFDYMLNVGFQAGAHGMQTESVERNSFVLYYRTYTLAVTTSAGETFYVQMTTDSTEIEASLAIILRVLVQCTLAAMLLVLIVGWFLSNTLVQGVTEAWERQDEFISYASHELRSPLAVIHSSLELLLDTPGARIIERSDLIMNSLTETSRLRKMASNLLEMVQLQAAEMTIHRENIQLDQMVGDFIEPFRYQAEAAGKTMACTLQHGLDIQADRQLLTELLAILLENALKYTEPGDSIRVSAQMADGKAVLAVSDTGVGIKDEALGKIFTRFYREERQQSKADGSGLGLYIASLIVTRHGGRITAAHNRPKGTTFAVTLPVREKGKA